jgi:hypothetical protein
MSLNITPVILSIRATLLTSIHVFRITNSLGRQRQVHNRQTQAGNRKVRRAWRPPNMALVSLAKASSVS